MLEIRFKTMGKIIVEGNLHSDILGLIDEYYIENGDLPCILYSLDEVEEIYPLDEALENGWLPINGGEWYIEGIAGIEEL